MALRSSTRVSSGFDLLRHSSPSFGSQQTCSYSNLSARGLPGRSMVQPHQPRGARPPTSASRTRLYFHYAFLTGVDAWARGPGAGVTRIDKVCHLTARMYVRLLGPCFKTGQFLLFTLHLERWCVTTPPTAYPRAPRDSPFWAPSGKAHVDRSVGARPARGGAVKAFSATSVSVRRAGTPAPYSRKESLPTGGGHRNLQPGPFAARRETDAELHRARVKARPRQRHHAGRADPEGTH